MLVVRLLALVVMALACAVVLGVNPAGAASNGATAHAAWFGDGDGPSGPSGPTGNEPSGPTGPTAPPLQWPAPPRGDYATLRANGRTATIPKSAPLKIKQMIKAANSLTHKPYIWGGGHAAWTAKGYDCSGATSYVLHAAGYLSWSMVSGDLAHWGLPGAGKWLRIYANNTHVFMVIAGLRYDTSPMGFGENGPRWRPNVRTTAGFKLRHPAGL